MMSLLQIFCRSSDSNERTVMDTEDKKEKTDRERLEDLKKHIDLCRIGWFKGALMKNFSSSDDDVIRWLQHLFFLAGSDKA